MSELYIMYMYVYVYCQSWIYLLEWMDQMVCN